MAREIAEWEIARAAEKAAHWREKQRRIQNYTRRELAYAGYANGYEPHPYNRDAEMLHTLFAEAVKAKNCEAAITWSAGNLKAEARVVVRGGEVVVREGNRASLDLGHAAAERYEAAFRELLSKYQPVVPSKPERRELPAWAKMSALAIGFATWGLLLAYLAQELFM